jgi:tetratricopeptide (TPR) repeat protein
MEQGRRDEAVKEFERLARQDPADRMARTRLVGAYVSANRSAEGQKVLEEALKKNPKDLDALLQRGEFAINAGKYREAEADLNQVVRLKPDSPEVHYAMAALHKARGATLLQRQELNQALQLNRAFLPARLELAKLLVSDSKTALDLLDKAPAGQQSPLPVIEQRNWILLAARQLAEARAGVDQGLAIARTADLLLQDGVLKIVEKRPNEGRQALREAMVKSPEDLRILGAIVQSYAMEKQMPAALQEIERHAAQHPQSAAVQYFLGTLFARTGDRVRAKQAFASAKAINPEFTADLSTAQIDLLQADWTSARQTLNTLLATKGENATARMWLGMVEASVGNHSAAIAAFRKVVDEQPNNPTALNNLAYLLAENANQPDEALKWAQKAKELEPGSARVDDTLGWVLYHKGLYTEAIRYLEGANAKEGTAIRKYHLAMAYLKAGQKERGRAAFQAAARLDPNLPEVKTARELFQ